MRAARFSFAIVLAASCSAVRAPVLAEAIEDMSEPPARPPRAPAAGCQCEEGMVCCNPKCGVCSKSNACPALGCE